MSQQYQQQTNSLNNANDKEANTMFISKTLKKLHNDQTGASALETAIILIAFVVVASVFAFTILSAGSASTEQSEESIYAGLKNVQSSMTTKGAIIAKEGTGDSADKVGSVVFTVSLASGGEPVNMDATATSNVIVIDYRDSTQAFSDLTWTMTPIVNDSDNLLEANEQFQITVTIGAGGTKLGGAGAWTQLGANTEFTLEVKPPTGAVLSINGTTPYVIEPVMELR